MMRGEHRRKETRSSYVSPEARVGGPDALGAYGVDAGSESKTECFYGCPPSIAPLPRCNSDAAV